jgi:hypothetical protein
MKLRVVAEWLPVLLSPNDGRVAQRSWANKALDVEMAEAFQPSKCFMVDSGISQLR